MLAKTVYFKNQELLVTHGIRAEFHGEHSLMLFSARGREIEMHVNAVHPPLLAYPKGGEDSDILRLGLLSLNRREPIGLQLIAEVDHYEKVLVFIDTCDDVGPQRNSGEYSLPIEFPVDLPHSFTDTMYGPAQYGLVICSPGETCVIRSTTGHLVKIKHGPEGKFIRVPCDAQDRALMDGRL